LFGIPAAHEDDELRAVKAALELHAAVRTIRTPALERQRLTLSVQSGIDAGTLVAQRLREGDRRYSIAGPAAQTAARLAAAGDPDAILISAACHALIGPFVVCEAAAPVTVRAGAEPVAAQRVLSESGVQTRLEADPSALTPFTGRSQELSSLEALVSELGD
jgi:class 3 adenylate cyclase